MGLEKVGASIGKKIIAWARTGGKSLLATRPVKINTQGLKYLYTLEQDTVQFSNKIEQVTKTAVKQTITTTPTVFKGSQVSMHHRLNSINSECRDAYNAATSNKVIDADDMLDIRAGLPKMFKIDNEFALLPPLEKDCIVYRGRFEHLLERFNYDFRIIDNAKVGDIVIPDTGYSYTAFKRELAENWANAVKRSMMFTIKLPKGAKVSRNLEHGGEVIIPRNAEYRLLSKTTNGKHTEVELEYILPNKNNVTEIEELMKKFNIEQTM